MRKKMKIGILIACLALLSIGATVIYTGCFAKGTSLAKDSDHVYYTCSMHPWVIQKGPGACPICGMKLVPKETKPTDTDPADRKILYWVSSMDPMYIRQEPGKDTMGMDLVPVYEDEASGSNTVSVDPSIIQSIGVRYATVKRGPLELSINAPAHIDYDEDHLAVLSTRAEGYIDKLYVTSPGSTVKAGDPLFDFYSPKLYSAQEEYLIALRVGDSSLAGAARERLKLLGISDAQINGIKKRGGSHALTITAPMNGTVVAMGGSGTGGGLSQGPGSLATSGGMSGGASSGGGGMGGMGGGGGGGGFSDSGGSTGIGSGMASGSGGTLREGSFIPAGSPVFTIADLSTVWVYAHIYVDQLAYVHKDLPAKLELDYLPGLSFDGTVDFVYPYLEQLTRDIRIRIAFPNPDGRLIPQMFGTVKLSAKIADDALVIPEEAVIFSGDHKVVFLALPENKFKPVEIITGPSDGNGNIQVVAGLDEGMQIVSSAQFLLDAESKTQAAINDMLSSQNGAARPPETSAVAPPDEAPSSESDNSTPQTDLSNQAPPPELEQKPVAAPKAEKPKEKPGKTASADPASKPAEAWPNLAPDDPNAKWKCPMSEDRYYAAEPGNDPICGMKLVPHDPIAWAKERGGGKSGAK